MDEIMCQSLEQAKKFKNPRVTILQEILKEKGKLNEKLVHENNAILEQFSKTFIAEMKLRDPLFEKLFNRIYYTGSYYSDLRVSAPDEYDWNLVLKFPFEQNTISCEYNPQVPSYAKYSTSDQDGILKEKGLNELFKEGYLIPNEVREWLQSVVDKALNTYNHQKYPQKVIDVQPSGSGPARTIILVKSDGCIDIDLVPVIEYSLGLKPPGIDGRVFQRVQDNLQAKTGMRNGNRKPKQPSMKKSSGLQQYMPKQPSMKKSSGLQQYMPKSTNSPKKFPVRKCHPPKKKLNLKPPIQKTDMPAENVKQIRFDAADTNDDIKAQINNDLPSVSKPSDKVADADIHERNTAKHSIPASSTSKNNKLDMSSPGSENWNLCFLVPKPYQPTSQAPVSEAECNRLWRTHFPDAEQIILHNCGCAKPVIKLLKLLRDKENWEILASYYLKTVVLWMILENSTPKYWKLDRLGGRFTEALNILAKNVKNRKICYFFSSHYNLLEKLTEAEASNIHGRLRTIIRQIERDPENLWTVFGCRKTFSLN